MAFAIAQWFHFGAPKQPRLLQWYGRASVVTPLAYYWLESRHSLSCSCCRKSKQERAAGPTSRIRHDQKTPVVRSDHNVTHHEAATGPQPIFSCLVATNEEYITLVGMHGMHTHCGFQSAIVFHVGRVSNQIEELPDYDIMNHSQAY